MAVNGIGNGTIKINGITCRIYCPEVLDPTTGRELKERLWSDALNWP